MATAQYYFDFAPQLRLCLIEEVLKKQSLITLLRSIALIELGYGRQKTDFGYVVFDDSFHDGIKRMTTTVVAA